MRKLFIISLCLVSLSSWAEEFRYHCLALPHNTYSNPELDITVETGWISGEVKRIGKTKLADLGALRSPESEFNKKAFMENAYAPFAKAAFAEKYFFLSDHFAYSSGFAKLEKKTYILEIISPSRWCYTGCATQLHAWECNKQ